MKKFLLLLSFIALNSNASSTVETHVTGVGIHGSGRFAVNVDKVIDENTCSMARFDILTSHKMYKEILSVALTAEATGKKVSIQTKGCTTGYPVPTFDDTDGSWIFIIE